MLDQSLGPGPPSVGQASYFIESVVRNSFVCHSESGSDSHITSTISSLLLYIIKSPLSSNLRYAPGTPVPVLQRALLTDGGTPDGYITKLPSVCIKT